MKAWLFRLRGIDPRVCSFVGELGDAPRCGHRYDEHRKDRKLSRLFGCDVATCIPCTEASGPWGKRTVYVHTRAAEGEGRADDD